MTNTEPAEEITDLLGRFAAYDTARALAAPGDALHEQLRLASGQTELIEAARRLPGVLSDLLAAGLTAGKVIALHSAIIDTAIRRALGIVFEAQPELDVDQFSWFCLGSNGRREAVPSSDIDSAVSFCEDIEQASDKAVQIAAYQGGFAEVTRLLHEAGLGADPHGATAGRRVFARTGAEWRQAAEAWLREPEVGEGAIMSSLMIDARHVMGDRGLPEVNQVFAHLREHPGSLRLQLTAALADRATRRPRRSRLTRRGSRYDIKTNALLPIVNIARWGALAVGSPARSTVMRLSAAGGSEMLPADSVDILIEVFEVLQRIRLEWQLDQLRNGRPATDVLDLRQVSSLDRSVISQAVREVAAVQRRMGNVAAYLSPDQWIEPGVTTTAT